MKISEIFRSIQGEGKTQGRNSLFIRFPYCNAKCCFCDSKYSWKDPKIEEISDETIYAEVEKCDNIVFTGGEPFLPMNMDECLKIMFKYSDKEYEFETNGTIELSEENLKYLTDFNYCINISPKENVEQETAQYIVTPRLLHQKDKLNEYIVKPLISGNNIDFEYIIELQEKFNIPSNKIYVQPIGIEFEGIKNIIINNWDAIMNRGWNISSRLHLSLFGNKRGI